MLDQKIVDRLTEIENDLAVYNAFSTDPSVSEDDRKVVAFKMLYEMMAFTALQQFAEGYSPKASTEFLIAASLKDLTKFVSTDRGKVVISPEYRELLSKRDEYLKNKN